ncbi:hypothetical protein [Serratia quinivorans]|nr:hypothetical protein [Serratia quinivorans]
MIIDVDEAPVIALATLQEKLHNWQKPFRHPGLQPGLFLIG